MSARRPHHRSTRSSRRTGAGFFELLRSNRPSLAVTALSSAFGVALLSVTAVLGDAARADDRASTSGLVASLLDVTALVFVGLAVYVGAVVSANTITTVVTGRARSLALQRLLGATASQLRRTIARESLLVGAVGAVGGGLLAVIVVAAGTALGVGTGFLSDARYDVVTPALAVPVVAVALTTWMAGLVGSRPVLEVTPLQALTAAEPVERDRGRRRPARTVAAALLFCGGGIVLAVAVAQQNSESPIVLAAFLGGIASFSGFVVGAHLTIPPALLAFGTVLGRSVPAVQARENATRDLDRSVRTATSLLVGVTLLATLVVATSTFTSSVAAGTAARPGDYAGFERIMQIITLVFGVLIGFSGVLAVIGAANQQALSLRQRRREIALLRALGMAAGQVRAMLGIESALLVAVSCTLGLAMGTVYGWAGAQTLLWEMPGLALRPPTVPWWLPVGAVLVAGATTAVAGRVFGTTVLRRPIVADLARDA